MALTKITYDNKVSLNPQPSVANVNKCTDSDLNEIKSVVNATIDQVDTNTENIENNSTYSTSEIQIGTWVDGKPLYRQVFNITNPSSSNTDYVSVSSLNISNLVHLYGFYKNSTGTFGIPFHDSDTNYSVLFVSSGNNIRGRFGTPSNITEAKVVLEYTKTTD